MNKIKNIFANIYAYLERKEAEKNDKETINLLMKLVFSNNTIKAVELKKQFDNEFKEVLAQRKQDFENNLKAIDSYGTIQQNSV